MPEQEGYFAVAAHQDTVYVRVIGLAGMTTSTCIRKFLDRTLEDGYRRFIFDLRKCSTMDSTFMGILAGAAIYKDAERPVRVVVVNARSELADLLKGLGLTELLTIREGEIESPNITTQMLYDEPTEEEVLEIVQAAHRNLVRMNESNQKQFGKFLEIFEQQIENKKAQSLRKEDRALEA